MPTDHIIGIYVPVNPLIEAVRLQIYDLDANRNLSQTAKEAFRRLVGVDAPNLIGDSWVLFHGGDKDINRRVADVLKDRIVGDPSGEVIGHGLFLGAEQNAPSGVYCNVPNNIIRDLLNWAPAADHG